MKLAELEPRWIHPNVFVFRCPHCPESGTLLSCKNVEMSTRDQCGVFVVAFGEAHGFDIVPCRPGMAWKISGADFGSMSVTPSLDASASGHWHGFITKGEIK